MKFAVATITLIASLAIISPDHIAAAEEDDLLVEATELSSGSIKATPQMWFYLQEKERYDDPQQARRRRAEEVAQERRRRIAAAKWMGFSKSRPTVNHTPNMSTYYPWDSWGLYTYGWARYGFPTFVIIQPQVESTVN